VEPFRIRSLATDNSSRTSVMLARIILRDRYGVTPQLMSLRPHLTSMLAHADAALIIGDPALQLEPATLPFHVLDLGEEWKSMTGLPMVFAVWAGHDSRQNEATGSALEASRDFGLQELKRIASEGARTRGITPELAYHYLSMNIKFKLDDNFHQGLASFRQLVRELRASESQMEEREIA
jgi:predicted solute-binding protein